MDLSALIQEDDEETDTTRFVVSEKAPAELLLIISIVSPTLGLLWLDHHRNITRIAAYVADVLWEWDPSWEVHIRQNRPPPEWVIVYWTSNLLVFLTASVSALQV